MTAAANGRRSNSAMDKKRAALKAARSGLTPMRRTVRHLQPSPSPSADMSLEDGVELVLEGSLSGILQF
jgi:hypothetical protein